MSTASTPVFAQRTVTSTTIHYEGSAPIIAKTRDVQTTIWTSMVTPSSQQLRQLLDEWHWDALFQDPRSDQFLDDLVGEILSESDAGLTQDLDELL